MEKKIVFRSQKDSGPLILASIPIYMFSFFKFLEWTLKFTNSQLAKYLWSDEDGNKKYILAN
jgi:hypothetical protein